MGIFSSILGGIASIFNGNSGSDAAKSAAQAQAQYGQQAIGEQRREFDLTQQNFAPWLNAGGAALQQERDLLGIGGQGTATPTIDYGAYVRSNPDILRDYQTHHAGEDINAYGKYHYQTQGQAAGDSLDPFTTTPAATGGVGANAAQQTAISNLQNSPLYTSLYNNGRDAVLANASATGGLRGGNDVTGLANFGRDTLASVIQQQLANLGGISGSGQNAAGSIAQAGSNSANQISSLLTNIGSSTAQGILGSAGAQIAGLNGAAAGFGSAADQLGKFLKLPTF